MSMRAPSPTVGPCTLYADLRASIVARPSTELLLTASGQAALQHRHAAEPPARLRTMSRPAPHRPAPLPLASRSETDLALRSFQILLEDLPPSPSARSSQSSPRLPRVFTRAWKRVAGTLRRPGDESHVPAGFVVVASPSRANF